MASDITAILLNFEEYKIISGSKVLNLFKQINKQKHALS